MTDTPKTGETEVAPSNGQAAPVTPQTTSTDTNERSEAEKLKEQLAQQARANQLANEELKKLREDAEAREKAEAQRKAKELEEQNEFKTLYEQEKAKREAIDAEREEEAKKAELAKAKQEVLGEYSEEVRKEAEDFGFDLTDTDEAAVAAFKDKLEKINARVTTSSTVRPNNPGSPQSTTELSGDDLKAKLQTDDGFHEYMTKKYPTIASMTKQQK